MSRFFSAKYSTLVPYTPGEQPQDKRYIKLNTNESPFPPSPSAQRMAREAAESLQLYSDPTCKALVQTAAAYYGIAESEILFTNGSDDILNLAFMAYCDADHPAIFPDITYGFYSVFAQLNGVPYETVPLKEDFTVDPGDYLGLGKTIFIANPNAPTGIALSRETVRQIVAANPDSIVVIDEAYVDFGGESAIGLIRDYPNLLVTGTFSKSRSLAGGRLGFGIGCAALIQDLNTLRFSTNPYNINRMTMAAGIGSLKDEDYFQTCRKQVMETRDVTADALRALGFTVLDSKANFLFAMHPKLNGKALYETLKDRGILIRHFETPRLRDYNRITIGSAAQMQTLTAELAKILEETT